MLPEERCGEGQWCWGSDGRRVGCRDPRGFSWCQVGGLTCLHIIHPPPQAHAPQPSHHHTTTGNPCTCALSPGVKTHSVLLRRVHS